MSEAVVKVGLILGLEYVFGLVENPHSLDRPWQKNAPYFKLLLTFGFKSNF